MSLRTFDELIALFPDLGDNGTYHEAKNWALPHATAQHLSAAHSTYSSDLQEAIQFWTENNEKIVPFMLEAIEFGETVAFSRMLARQTKKFAECGLYETPAQDAQSWCDRAKWFADQLRSASYPLPSRPRCIFRGESIDSALLGVSFAVGSRLSWTIPKAFSVECELVPLHFAWKQWKLRRQEGIVPVGIILEVELHPNGDTPLLWASEAPPRRGRADMRWQREVLTAPGMQVEVISCDLILKATAPVYAVKALEVRP